jgi:predicted ATP-grasp superfamily ATP-dependent carboligase
MTRVLLLCAGPWIGLRIAYCLRAAGYEVDVLADRRVAFKSSRYVRKCTTLEFPAVDAPGPDFTTFVREYVEDNGIDCVIGDHVETQVLIDQMSGNLGPVARFPGMPTKDLRFFNDKWAFNQLLPENDLPGPPSHVIRQANDAFGPAAASLSFPVIVKPLTKEGSQGVVKVDTIAELESYVSGDRPHSELPLMVQKFLPGHDAGFSFLAAGGRILGWSLQRYNRDDGSIEFFRSGEIEDFGARLARLTNYTGVANIDLRVDDDDRLLGVIKCNPRFWSSIVASRVHGLNFVKAGVDLALGADPEILNVGEYREGKYFTARAAVKRWIANRGTFDGIDRENIRELCYQTIDILPYVYRVFTKTPGRDLA